MNARRLAVVCIAIAAPILLAASHLVQDGEVRGVLVDCAVTPDGGGFHETCDLASDDDRLAGSWS